MHSTRAKLILERANKRIRSLCGPGYEFIFNKGEGQFEFWEHRGPMHTMVFPLTIGNRALNNITDWEIEHAVKFVRRSRRPEVQEEYFKQKKYKQWTEPWNNKKEEVYVPKAKTKWVN